MRSTTYRIRIPNPNKQVPHRYLFSVKVDASVVEAFCHSPVEELVVKNTPAWVLILLGQSLLDATLDISSFSKTLNIHSPAYQQKIDEIFAEFPSIPLATGRPFQGKLGDLSPTRDFDFSIMTKLMSYWEQGLKAASALLSSYVSYIHNNNHHLAFSLASIMLNLRIHKKNEPICIHELTHKQLKALLSYNTSYQIFYSSGSWFFSNTPYPNDFNGGTSKGKHKNSTASDKKMSKIEHIPKRPVESHEETTKVSDVNNRSEVFDYNQNPFSPNHGAESLNQKAPPREVKPSQEMEKSKLQIVAKMIRDK